MTALQYIGARYVPIFYTNNDGTSEWRNGVIYEPLTIVTYNGNSYTSKKAVPASVGNPSANPEYWVSTGNYNEQVERYRQEVEALRDEVSAGANIIFVRNSDSAQQINGTCAIIKSEDDVTMIDLSYDFNVTNVNNALLSSGIDRIDRVIISHWHSDHASIPTLNSLISNGFIDSQTQFYIAKKAGNLATWNSELDDNYNGFIAVLTANNIAYTFPDNDTMITAGNVQLSFANASAGDIAFYDNNSTDYNDYSMVVYAEYNGKRVIFEADIDAIAAKRIYDTGYAKPCILANAAHHGVAGTNQNFLLTVSPKYAVITGSRNYMVKGNGNSSAETNYYGAMCDEVIATCDNDVIYNMSGNFLTMYANRVKVKPNSSLILNVYVDSSYSGVEHGTPEKPFINFVNALAFANTVKGIDVKINGNGFTVPDYTYIDNLSCGLILSGVNFPGLRVQNMKHFELENSTITKADGIALRIERSNAYLSGVTVDGDSTGVSGVLGAGLYARMSKVRATTIALNTRRVGIYVEDAAEVTIQTLTGSGTNCAVVGDLESTVVVNTNNATYNNNFSDASASVGGAIGQMVSKAVYFNVGTIDNARFIRDRFATWFSLDIHGLALSSQVTQIGTISEALYRPQREVYIPAVFSAGGYGSGVQHAGLLTIDSTGAVNILCNEYASITHLKVSGTYRN